MFHVERFTQFFQHEQVDGLFTLQLQLLTHQRSLQQYFIGFARFVDKLHLGFIDEWESLIRALINPDAPLQWLLGFRQILTGSGNQLKHPP